MSFFYREVSTGAVPAVLRKKMRILCTINDFSNEAKPLLEKAGTVTYRAPSQEELPRVVSEYDALLVRIGLQISRDVIDAAPHLKAIATATTGLNHIDVVYAKEKGITVLSLKDEVEFLDTITSTAELAFGLLIDLMRMTPAAFESVKRYEFKLEEFRGHSLYGKTLGVIGMGRLGKIMAEGAAGWRMNVIFADPNVPQEKFPRFKKVELDELLATSDAISLHVHLTPETEKMIDAGVIRNMKRGVFFVNTARGELVDEDAVLDALQSGQLGGYATDVLANEAGLLKRFESHPLVEYAKTHRNCIVVPHTGGLTHDSRKGTDLFIAQKLARFLGSTSL